MHFYSLLYAKLMEKEDPERSEKYKERARLFAKDLSIGLERDGEALPYGRSLTYRFAQVSFWCALAFANVEVFPWGVIKGIINRHFRWWFSKPIFDSEGKLTLGYSYPNLTVCEGYNAPNSPYWALKSFLILALPETHPLWEAKEEELPVLDSIHYLPHSWMIMQREKDGYVTALTSGQYAEWEPVHVAEKFEKICISWKAPPEDISGGAFWYTIWEESYLVQPHLIGILHKLQAFPQQRQLPAVSCRHGTAGPTIHHIPLYRLPF